MLLRRGWILEFGNRLHDKHQIAQGIELCACPSVSREPKYLFSKVLLFNLFPQTSSYWRKSCAGKFVHHIQFLQRDKRNWRKAFSFVAIFMKALSGYIIIKLDCITKLFQWHFLLQFFFHSLNIFHHWSLALIIVKKRRTDMCVYCVTQRSRTSSLFGKLLQAGNEIWANTCRARSQKSDVAVKETRSSLFNIVSIFYAKSELNAI